MECVEQPTRLPQAVHSPVEKVRRVAALARSQTIVSAIREDQFVEHTEDRQGVRHGSARLTWGAGHPAKRSVFRKGCGHPLHRPQAWRSWVLGATAEMGCRLPAAVIAWGSV